MKRTSRRVVVAVLLISGITAQRSAAHGFAPSFLGLREESGGRTEVVWKTPRVVLPGVGLQPVLPAVCEMAAPPSVSEDETTRTSTWVVDCSEGLVGQTIEVAGLGDSQTDVLLSIRLADGRLVRGVLSNRQPAYRVPQREPFGKVASGYVGLGIEHILLGFDHLLFVAGLLLLVRGRRLLLRTITGFTLGHSVTLSCVVLGAASVPPRLAELAIALSILVLATELARPETARRSLLRRFPPLMASVFGLLHGLGFAGALIEVGLPPNGVPLALFSFNVGIEVGQLLFVAAVLVFFHLSRPVCDRMPSWSATVPVYCIGTLAAFWSLERLAALF